MKARKVGRHKSVPKSIKRAVKGLQGHENVKKVILGPFHPCRHKRGAGSLELREDVAQGLKLYGYCGGGISTLYVYLRDPSRREAFKEEMGIDG